MLVMFTTLIFGTFMDPVQKFLVPPKKKDVRASTHLSEMMPDVDYGRHPS